MRNHLNVPLTGVEGRLVGCADFCYDSDIQTRLMPLAAPSVRENQNKIWFSAHLIVPLIGVEGRLHLNNKIPCIIAAPYQGALNVLYSI